MLVQKLKIGLFGSGFGILRILNQESLEYALVDLNAEIKPQDFAAIIVAAPLPQNQAINLKNYLFEGGALLIMPQFSQKIIPELKLSKTKIDYIAGKEKIFNKVGRIWFGEEGYEIQGAQFGNIDNSSKKAILLSSSRKGHYIVFPFDANSATLNEEWARRAFSSPYKRCADEEVSKVAKGNVRQLLLNCLMKLFSMRKLPYVHFWYYPNCHSTVFTFRIDLDKWDLQHIKTTLRLAVKNDITTTWFVNTDDSEKFGTAPIKELLASNQEVQSHAHKHFIYSSYSENHENLKKAEAILSKAGIKPTAFVSPFGHWNQPLGEVLRDLNYGYCIQATLDTDNFPFHPIIKNDLATILNIPNHSMCIFLLSVYDYNEEMMKAYFKQLIDEKYKACLPIMLYGHPTKEIGLHPEVIDYVFKYIKTLNNIWITTLNNFFEFWKKREHAKISAKLDANKLVINSENISHNLCVRIVTSENRELLLPAKPDLELSLIELENSSVPIPQIQLHDFEPKLSKVRLSKRILHSCVMRAKKLLGKLD